MSEPEKSDMNALKESTRMIICAIDSLKGRKARPDEQKICNWVQRKYGLKKADIGIAIREAVGEGSVLKVKYKDSVSYRNPLKFSHKMSNHIMSMSGKCWNVSQQTMKRVLRELRVLSRTSALNGVSKAQVIDSLHSNCQSVTYTESMVDTVLNRAVQTGSVKVLANGNYMLSGGKRIVPRKGDPDQSSSAAHPFQTDNFGANSDNDHKNIDRDNDELDLNEDSSPVPLSANIGSVLLTRKKASLEMKRERPVSTRKKFKKSLGPDFIESSELGLQYMRNSFEPKCDLCQLRSKFNKRGEREQLLSCKDCSAKAHPSCMEYSEELAQRSSLSPWQCMECKTCHVCHDSSDGQKMIICDLCDRGYHMNCHIPLVRTKPIGKWECNECIGVKNNSLEKDSHVNELNSIDSTEQQIVEESEDLEVQSIDKKTERILNKRNSESSSLSSFASNSKENYGNSCADSAPNPQNWSPEDVQQYIRSIGFPEQSVLFKEQEIDGTSLLLLRRSDVLTGFHMKLGPALKIYSHIIRLQKND